MGPLSITYIGQCGFLLDFGSVRIVTDPYLSDYVDRAFSSGSIIWKRLYPPPVSLADLRPDLVLISHSHADHMDPWTLQPYLRGGGQAVIAAPAPECALPEALGAPAIVYAESGIPFRSGDIVITPVPCAHTELHPDRLGRFRELSYLIASGSATVFFGGDMSLYPGLRERLCKGKCDVMLLPVNGRDEERTANGIIGNMDPREAAWLAKDSGAQLFIPMHHDLYAANGCAEETIRKAAAEAGAPLYILKPMETLYLP